MKFEAALADDTVLREIGRRLARHRIEQRLTQAALAAEAGVSKRTVERIEAGASTQLTNLVRVLRVLGLVPGLEAAVPSPRPSPLALLEQAGRVARRVRPSSADPGAEPWTWDDEPGPSGPPRIARRAPDSDDPEAR